MTVKLVIYPSSSFSSEASGQWHVQIQFSVDAESSWVFRSVCRILWAATLTSNLPWRLSYSRRRMQRGPLQIVIFNFSGTTDFRLRICMEQTIRYPMQRRSQKGCMPCYVLLSYKEQRKCRRIRDAIQAGRRTGCSRGKVDENRFICAANLLVLCSLWFLCKMSGYNNCHCFSMAADLMKGNYLEETMKEDADSILRCRRYKDTGDPVQGNAGTGIGDTSQPIIMYSYIRETGSGWYGKPEREWCSVIHMWTETIAWGWYKSGCRWRIPEYLDRKRNCLTLTCAQGRKRKLTNSSYPGAQELGTLNYSC